ncbi:MAG: PP2C family protein-serine/threonine phosphatase [Planctomycetaceae bacterium]|jgi:phosphoserine phosphatase RsbU/P|nr:serine/threonine-protein phosphatase [bacterium]MDB4787043.1 serine/threonine-protein phosphatase [Planctomycetaceae bacterium]MDC0273820.1 serine/threonine-protein phosphatase [Planctomycetaceae bacterium]MDG2390851.1 PP2C family protein-serine/threonine phosphatase [Planctomycetaceae bacterium]
MSNLETSSTSPHRMECMELWGGNSAVDKTISMTGLEAQIYSRPYDPGESGGDVYYFTACASGRISRFLLADVTGHGQRVAGTADKLRGIMRENVNVIRQSNLMDGINKEFSAITEGGGFATAVVATYFSPRQTLTVSLAGHPRPLLYRAETERWSVFGEDGDSGENLEAALPLGIKEDVVFQNLQVRFSPGDMLLCYTDAFSESVDESDQLINTQGLLEILNQEQTAANSLDLLTSRLSDLSATNLTNDDATAILVRPTGQRITMKANLLAPFRMVSGVKEVNSSEDE